jgi:hypothetical protein
MTLDKTHIARWQLGVALALFLEDLDPIVVQVLACTAGEVAEYLAVKASGQPFTARALATFRNNSWRDIRRVRNQFWSSFRYATTHDDDQDGYSTLMSGFSDVQNDHALLVGWHDLMASKKLPIEAQVFQSWYFALYQEKLGSKADVSRLVCGLPLVLWKRHPLPNDLPARLVIFHRCVPGHSAATKRSRLSTIA